MQTFLLSCLLLGTTGLAEQARGQSDEGNALIEEAMRLRDAGDFPGAVRVLRPYAEAHPDQPWAALLLAQTLYWAGDAEAAQDVYEQALVRHPNDLNLRLEYARMLVDVLDAARARAMLRPLQREEITASEAERLLGTLAYWQGDWSAAKKHFKEALRRNPEHVQARRQLHEIRAFTVPWAHASSTFRRDNQPLSRLTFSAETGAYLTPLSPLSLQLRTNRYEVGDSLQTTLGVEAAFRWYWPGLRLDTDVKGGFFDRSSDVKTAWTWHVGAGVHLPMHCTLRGVMERAPYVETTTSLSASVMTETILGFLEWNAPRGWEGQAAFSYVRYPDENSVRTAYAWLLAPLIGSAPASLKVGYSYANQDAQENRFVPVGDGTPPPDELSNGLEGSYLPYYTPEKLQKHSVLALLAVHPASTVTFQVNASYGLYATEDAPFLYAEPATGSQPAVILKTFYSRRFYPWHVRSTLTAALAPNVTLSLVGEHQRKAYYQTTEVGLKLIHRFTNAVVRDREHDTLPGR